MKFIFFPRSLSLSTNTKLSYLRCVCARILQGDAEQGGDAASRATASDVELALHLLSMVVDNADEVLRGVIERSMLVPTCLARLLAAGVIRVECLKKKKNKRDIYIYM